jgi:hypothetical protein
MASSEYRCTCNTSGELVRNARLDDKARLGSTKNTRFGLTPSSNPVGGILEDVEMGEGEVIRRRACGGSGYGNIAAFGFEDEYDERVVSGVVSGLRRIMGIWAVYKSRRSSWDSSRVDRSSIRRTGKGIDARSEDDKRITCDDEDEGLSGLL